MSWDETPTGRFTVLIHKLFEEYTTKYSLQDYKAHNALLDVRNLVVQAVQGFLQEPAIKKKYGIPIDSMSLISFSNAESIDPRSSWIPIPSNEDETRPAGITNEELREFETRIDKLFRDGNMSPSDLHIKTLFLFREAFLKPALNRPFRAGTYVRFGASGFVKDQAVPCEICGESRAVDMCHIIPRRLRGSERDDNILFLCPTHHRLFDICMLSREEWDKIDWERKAKKSQIYAEKVLKVAHGNFWEKVGQGIYKKRNSEELDVYELRRLYRENVKDIEEEP
ncbi:MAG: HNH endonuclease [Nitrospirae bacterium]|nr:HNH endonuclease [Nitrospirota bacterium]